MVRFKSGELIRVPELHALLTSLPVRAYRFVQRDDVTTLVVGPAPGADHHALELDLRRVMEPELTRLELSFGDVEGFEVRNETPPKEVLLHRQRGELVVSSEEPAAKRAIEAALEGRVTDALRDVVLRGLQPECATRPVLAVLPPGGGAPGPIAFDRSRCTSCGDCADACPVRCISLTDGLPEIDATRCVRCHLCSESCQTDALAPYLTDDAVLAGTALVRQVPLLAQLRKPPQEPPTQAWKRVPHAKDRPPVVLGLATVTLMEHAAALMIGGELVAVVEEERLTRERHYRYKAPGRPGASLASDPTLPLDASWPPHAVKTVLRLAGLTLDDVDAIALNGMPYRLRESIQVGQAGRLVFVPHHLCHAASVLGAADFDDGWLFAVDGRGDRETASLWRLDRAKLDLVDHVPFFPDRSFGGVYETITRILGFGSHGQGSTMALAAFGEPTDSIDPLSEWAAARRCSHLARSNDAPLTDAHRNLAASAQHALETSVLDLLKRGLNGEAPKRLGLAGGVALNCRMNGVIRRAFPGVEMAVPPGANDAGTAVGAAIIAHRELTGELVRPNPGHAYLGPSWDDAAIERTLQRAGVRYELLDDVSERTAMLLEEGAIVGWVQGRMEYGPRALGGRSLLADPRRPDVKARLNRMKSREPWRPFGSSILAGHQAEWFEDDWDSRYMLFAVQVREHRRSQVPVITHFDGSTRPQVVHAAHAPRFHAMISAFHRRTGVPMVVNTSFNRGGEPIVMSPLDALKSFAGLGADALVMGRALVRGNSSFSRAGTSAS